MANEIIEEYRRNAEECRAQSVLSRRAEDRARWLRLAWHWLMLADAAGPPGTASFADAAADRR